MYIESASPRMGVGESEGECYFSITEGVEICFTEASITPEGVVLVKNDSLCVFVEEEPDDVFASVSALVVGKHLFRVNDSGHTTLLDFLRKSCGGLEAETTFVLSSSKKFGAVSIKLRSA